MYKYQAIKNQKLGKIQLSLSSFLIPSIEKYLISFWASKLEVKLIKRSKLKKNFNAYKKLFAGHIYFYCMGDIFLSHEIIIVWPIIDRQDPQYKWSIKYFNAHSQHSFPTRIRREGEVTLTFFAALNDAKNAAPAPMRSDVNLTNSDLRKLSANF